jgi:hypothetical protein
VLTNYDITSNTALLTISKAAASVTTMAATKVYGQADPTLTGTLSGFLPADNVTASYSRVAGENVGTYAISASLSPAGVLANYDIAYNTASLTISHLAATITPIASSKLWGAADPTLTGTLTGFLPGITATWTRVQGENVGTYPITATLSASPTVLANYTITTNTALFTINQTAATMTFPAPGSQLGGSTQTFTWNSGGAATQYDLYLSATRVGGSELYNSAWVKGTSVTVTGLPTTGVTIYARLFSIVNGVQQFNDYTLSAAGTLAPATLISPAPGSTLTGSSATFTWTTGSGATQYDLYVGTNGVGTFNLYNSRWVAGTSVNVTGLPTTGVTIYVRLFSILNGVQQFNDYTLSAAGTLAPATLISPAPDSTLTGSSATFTWTTGSGVTAYDLYVGTGRVGAANLYNSGWVTGTSVNVTGLPTTGVTIYVRLISVVNGVQQYNDYTMK